MKTYLINPLAAAVLVLAVALPAHAGGRGVATIEGTVDFETRSDDSGAVVEAWNGAVLENATTSDASGYFYLSVPSGAT